MTDREAFLTRWSRRKREAAATPAQPAPEESAVPAPAESEKSEPLSAAPVPPSQSEPELPPIDAIDGGTDIRAFLKEGVPQDLARAALRRAWSSDPAIRDFIGLSENSWDFTAPEGVPGFGPFAPDAARQLVARVLGDAQTDSSAEPSVAAVAKSDRVSSGADSSEHEVVNRQENDETEAQPVGGVFAPDGVRPDDDTAMQQEAAGPGSPPETSGSSG